MVINGKAEAELEKREKEWLEEYKKRELAHQKKEALFRQQETLFLSSQLEFEKLRAIQEKRIELAMCGQITECLELMSEENEQRKKWQSTVANWNLFVFNDN